MTTTIQIHEDVKNELDRLKETGKETYEEVILNLMNVAEKCKREQKSLLIEGYKEMTKESLAVSKEWSNADKVWK
ncbi:MAG: hypothetical protein Q7J54_08135 [Candidatus Woesearchaeota archaeon]|nr:hypothetical protein [Candidatus Woesearchaeota archaeon]